MTDIQRYRVLGEDVPDDNGAYVVYVDHLIALRQAEDRGWEQGRADHAEAAVTAYEQGQQDAIMQGAGASADIEFGRQEAIREAVQRVEAWWASGTFPPSGSPGWQAEVIAAIKGEQT